MTERLGADLETTDSPVGLELQDLVGLALRRNPRRAHLLVSGLLAKHVPVDPRLARAAGHLLGALVAAHLAGTPAPDLARWESALGGRRSEGLGDLRDLGEPGTAPSAGAGLVIGFAETATGLGHLVADRLDAPYLHSTRRRVAAVPPVLAFEESHSHATSHLLAPRDPAMLDVPGPVVLVDDELSTGATALATIAALQRRCRRGRYLIAALVDVRDDADRAWLARRAEELAVRIDVVALAAGRAILPADLLGRAMAIVDDLPPRPTPRADGPAPGALRRRTVRWPVAVGGRHGLSAAARAAFADAASSAAAALATDLPGRGRVHVLGTEELMALPLHLAAALAEQLPDVRITVSSTTRSPVVAVDEAGYPVRAALAFAPHDLPADGPSPRFAYNLGVEPIDVLVVLVEETVDTGPLHAPDGLIAALATVAPSVLLVELQEPPQHA